MSIPAKKKGPKFSKTQELVTFKIGKDNKIETFVVHKESACHYSPVLKAAFNSDFIEGQTQTYILEDIGEHSIESFTLFVEWLYTQKLDLLQELKDIVDGDKEYRNIPVNTQRTVAAQTKAAEVWILAEKLLVPSLQNLAIEQFERISFDIKRIPSDGHIKYIFANTSQGSPLRTLTADLQLWSIAWIQDNPKDLARVVAAMMKSFPEEFMALIITALIERHPFTTTSPTSKLQDNPPNRGAKKILSRLHPYTQHDTPKTTKSASSPTRDHPKTNNNATSSVHTGSCISTGHGTSLAFSNARYDSKVEVEHEGKGEGKRPQLLFRLRPAGRHNPRRSGEKEEKFIVHKAFACHYSPVFKAAFESGFIEGQTQTYKLEDAEPKVVQLLVQWLYTQRLDIRVDMEVDNKLAFPSAVSVWALADKLLLPGLQNEVVDWIFRVREEACICPTSCLKHAYACTGAGSLLRQLFVSHTARMMSSQSYEKIPEQFPQEFLVDLAAYFSENFVALKDQELKENFHVQAGISSETGMTVALKGDHRRGWKTAH
ncbi:hypothetical protein LARI1_G008201 [Lachnellula arida]|uniref:BTB domain-containing protein n=1 Tax=Lachnellula arida TaxID=1316785 RepID=A0A8T9B1Z7_9HELO|nr:hypothetical protein LARI1_G008201 [Lachnellula arida]